MFPGEKGKITQEGQTGGMAAEGHRLAGDVLTPDGDPTTNALVRAGVGVAFGDESVQVIPTHEAVDCPAGG